MKLLSKIFVAASAVVTLTASAALNPGNLPLWFEAGSPTQYIARGQGLQVGITAAGSEIFMQRQDGDRASVRMTFVGGNSTANISGAEKLEAKINRFIGNDSSKWQKGVPTFAKVRATEIYPGVDVVYYGSREKLEYDFQLAAGVNPEIIALRFDGAKISINPQGELVVSLNGGEIKQHRPIAYQTVAGQQTEVSAAWRIVDEHTAAFQIGSYNRALPLVIDPIVTFTTYFGGAAGESAIGVAVSPVDNTIFICGQTFSTKVTNGVPFSYNTASAFTNFGGGSLTGDAFVARFTSDGSTLLSCTYLGGKSDDAAFAIAVDTAGHPYVAGYTQSTNFPVLNPISYGSYDGGHLSGKIIPTIRTFPGECFVTELEVDGSSLIYSTYLGGNKYDAAFGIAVDPAGNAYVTGYTTSTNFPVTEAAFQKQLKCPKAAYLYQNAFVAEIAAGGGQLNYSTFLGGTNNDTGNAIAYTNGHVIVVGETTSTNFPWTNGLAQCHYLNGITNRQRFINTDGFVTSFLVNGTNLDLQYSTFLGSSNLDVASSVAVDSTGNAYVVGWTTSMNFPTAFPISGLSSYVRTNKSNFAVATNAFLTKLAWNDTSNSVETAFSQMFGGRGQDLANGVALDSFNNVYVVGTASSTNFPVIIGSIPVDGTNSFSTNSCLRATNSGASDTFITAFAVGGGMLGSAYVGGKANDFGNAIAIDTANTIIVVGSTTSTNLPVFNAFQKYRNGTNDTFISKFNFVD